MTRKKSHFETPEPILEHLLRFLRFRKMSKYIGINSKVVDVGCGYNGEFLRSINRKIIAGVGYDISVNHKAQSNTIKLINVDLNNKLLWKGKEKFDLAVSSAVIEHIENPTHFLSSINGLLKKNGVLLITTPHIRSKKILEYLSMNLGLISEGEIADHKQYFDENSLAKVLINTGFQVVEISTFEFGLNIFCLAKRIS